MKETLNISKEEVVEAIQLANLVRSLTTSNPSSETRRVMLIQLRAITGTDFAIEIASMKDN